jgi:hypothetical protein
MSNNFYRCNSHVIGNFQISAQQPVDTTENAPSGLIVDGYSAYWGGGSFIYGQYGGTVAQYGLCNYLATLTSGRLLPVFTHQPNTANLGYDCYVAMVGGTVGQYGWFMRAGVTPINGTASVAAGVAVGITAAGQIGANTAGKQLLGAKNALAATTTVAKTGCTGKSGSFEIQVPNADGWFIGAYMSGTGVGAAAKIASIDPSGRKVTVDVVSTAAINGTVTATYNNATIFYNVVEINAPLGQGAIT